MASVVVQARQVQPDALGDDRLPRKLVVPVQRPHSPHPVPLLLPLPLPLLLHRLPLAAKPHLLFVLPPDVTGGDAVARLCAVQARLLVEARELGAAAAPVVGQRTWRQGAEAVLAGKKMVEPL